MGREARSARRGETPDPKKSRLKRCANAELRAAKITTEASTSKCPRPTGTARMRRGEFAPLGKGKPSSVTEYVQGYSRKRIFRRETVACACGHHVITANVPDKVVDRTQYGPRLYGCPAIVRSGRRSGPDFTPFRSARPWLCGAGRVRRELNTAQAKSR